MRESKEIPRVNQRRSSVSEGRKRRGGGEGKEEGKLGKLVPVSFKSFSIRFGVPTAIPT